MNKTGLLICGNSGIDYENYDFPYEIIRSTLIIDGKEYEDFVDIKAEDFYNILVENPNVSLSTAQASTGIIAERMKKMKAEGYTDIIAIIISSALSGTYQNVMLAKDLVDGINVHVIDSKTVSFGQLYLVDKAIDLIKKDYEANKIVEALEQLKENIQIYVLVDTLKFLVKNGRLSATSGMIGKLLKIKPLLHFNENGQLVPYERIRTFSKAKKRLIELAKKEIDKGIESLSLAYTNNKELTEEIKAEILAYKPDLDIKLFPLTPVVGAHAGPGTCGFGIIKKRE